MPVHNAEIADKLSRLADLLEIEGANPFRVRAYRNAAQTILNLPRSVAEMVAAGEDLCQLPGIGEALAKKLKEIVETGELSALQKEEKNLPRTLSDLLKIPSLGPKRVHLMYEKLKIADENDLEKAVRSGKLQTLPGFGPKTEQKILEYLEQKKNVHERTRLAVAEEVVTALIAYLRKSRAIKRLTPTGSYRRRLETVGDVDLLVTGVDAPEIMKRFVTYEGVDTVLAQGETRSSVKLRSGLQVDLRVVPEESYGAALHYFTGSKAHNIAIRTRGVKLGLKINEYGIYKGQHRVGGAAEEEVFAAVGLPYIEPELRENRGEIEAAEKGHLPHLVKLEDIKGDLQSHTNATDGHFGPEEMAEAARARGYQYLAITDHSKRVAMAHGLNATRLRQQMRQIEALNQRMRGFVLLKSVEVDILEDGSLDLSDDVLRELDIVVAAIHYGFNLGRDKQTERIIRAMDNPYVHILAHPTGRLIGERPPYELDMEHLLQAAKERGCFMELNAHPIRLDLNDVHCRMAKEIGVKVAISTDAHSITDLDHMRFGVDQARRGWLEPEDIVNTRSWEELRRLLRRS
ncbi:MAG: DNA polymerase/3'-5' exonuclease PolX [Kiritimatiellae bacterium]|nr:DNA polymerase/3'-5' exonuclease PolX [Kiritimatiellia bacterium]